MLRHAAAAGIASKVISAFCNLAAVPIVLRAMGETQFGMWATYQSLQMLLPFADFGIGNGMMNGITHAFSRQNETRIRTLVSSATALLLAVSVVCGVALFLAWPFVAAGLGAGPSAAGGSVRSKGLAVFVAGGLLSIPLSCADRVAAALQMGYVSHVARALTSVLSLMAVYAAAQENVSFPGLCLATVAPPLLAPIATWMWLGFRYPFVSPRLRMVSQATARALARTGLAFLAVQVTAILGFGLDIIIIERFAGAESAAQFAIAQRFYGIVPMVAGIAFAPLWPAYADASIRRDYSWITWVFYRTFFTALAVAAAAVTALTACMPVVMPLWLGDKSHPPTSLLLLCAAWTVAYVGGMSLSFFWNGMHWLRLQVTLGAMFSVGTLIAKLGYVRQGGVEALVFINVIGYTVIMLIPGAFASIVYLRSSSAIMQDAVNGGLPVQSGNALRS